MKDLELREQILNMMIKTVSGQDCEAEKQYVAQRDMDSVLEELYSIEEKELAAKGKRSVVPMDEIHEDFREMISQFHPGAFRKGKDYVQYSAVSSLPESKHERELAEAMRKMEARVAARTAAGGSGAVTPPASAPRESGAASIDSSPASKFGVTLRKTTPKAEAVSTAPSDRPRFASDASSASVTSRSSSPPVADSPVKSSPKRVDPKSEIDGMLAEMERMTNAHKSGAVNADLKNALKGIEFKGMSATPQSAPGPTPAVPHGGAGSGKGGRA